MKTAIRLFLIGYAVMACLCADAAQFTLTWTDNSNVEAGFYVERANKPDPVAADWVRIAGLGANVQSYVDANLPGNTYYIYRVQAWNAAGVSGYSNTAGGTTPPVLTLPKAPGGLLAESLNPAYLSNISTRTEWSDGNEPVISGFVIAGTGTLKVLVRAVGPGIVRFGVPNAMGDPQLELVGVGTNNNWQDGGNGAAIANAGAKVGAFPLEPGSKDAAMLVDLLPGVYTMHTVAADGVGGVVLTEVYAVPADPQGGATLSLGGVGGVEQ